MIQLENICKSFKGNAVLRGINLDLEKGEIMALVGMSGFGKSVLLKCIAGLIKPDEGRVIIDGTDINTLKGKDLFSYWKRIGFLFQGGALFESMTVFENIAFPLREKTGLHHEEIRAKVIKQLEEVGLADEGEKYPSQLSGGMRKRTALARELVWEPEIMLFDEPTTGLDPIISHAILNLIEALHVRLNFTAILVTHELTKVFEIVNRVAMIHKGKIELVGSAPEIIHSVNPVVRQFINGDVEGPISFR
jgi:phospholipid/cholesterol/gamma-HCH transport system ATP-binding protein